jgi:hypothetical protein
MIEHGGGGLENIPVSAIYKASEKGREGRSVDFSVEKSESDQPAKRKSQKRDTAMCNPLFSFFFTREKKRKRSRNPS